jgi:hypothetical protein
VAWTQSPYTLLAEREAGRQRATQADLAGDNYPDALQAQKLKLGLLAAKKGPVNDLEQECWGAMIAYEKFRTASHYAARTRPIVKRVGIVAAVHAIVSKVTEGSGYNKRADSGMLDYAFEAVVRRHPEHFSARAVANSRQRVGR